MRRSSALSVDEYENGFRVPPPRLTAAQVLDALESRLHRSHPNTRVAARHLFVRELRLGTGWSIEQRVDAFSMLLWPSDRFLRTAYEVKVGRGDFQRELRQPEKRRAALEVADEFYFAAPLGLIDRGEVPAGCGLIEVLRQADGGLVARVGVPAPARLAALGPPPVHFVAALARRLAS